MIAHDGFEATAVERLELRNHVVDVPEVRRLEINRGAESRFLGNVEQMCQIRISAIAVAIPGHHEPVDAR